MVPVARTAKPRCSPRKARSSEVTGSAPVAPVMMAPWSSILPSFDHSLSRVAVTSPGRLRSAVTRRCQIQDVGVHREIAFAAAGGERDLAVDSNILNLAAQGNAAPGFL